MPDRVRSRRQFARLAASSHRGRSGPIRVHYVEPSEPTEHFAVAYAIGRAVGHAVARNRLRRRLRALMDEIRPGLPDGLYLIKCDFRAESLAFGELRRDLSAAIEDASVARVG